MVMNLNIPYILNIIGLFFDIIGAIFVAWEVAKQFKGKKFYDISPPQCGNWEPRSPETDEFIKYTKLKEYKMQIGLCFLLIGFALQILSNFWSIFYNMIN